MNAGSANHRHKKNITTESVVAAVVENNKSVKEWELEELGGKQQCDDPGTTRIPTTTTTTTNVLSVGPVLRDVDLTPYDNHHDDYSAAAADAGHDIVTPPKITSSQHPQQQEQDFDAPKWRRLWTKQLREHGISYKRKEQEILHLYQLQQQASSSLSSTAVAQQQQQQQSPRLCNFILLSGPPGSPTSELARHALLPVVQSKQGYLVTGRFDTVNTRDSQFRHPVPYKALIEALSDLARCVAREDENKRPDVPSQWSEKLHSQLSAEELGVLCSRIPGLETTLGRDPKKRALASGMAGKQEGSLSAPLESVPGEPQMSNNKNNKNNNGNSKKFIFAFWKFVRVVGSMDYPVVLLLENLHEADWCFIDVLLGLVHDSENLPGLMIVGTSREYPKMTPEQQESTDCFSEDYLKQKWTELEEACGGHIPTVSVPYLSATDVSNFLGNTFSLERENETFTQMVMDQTGGNQMHLLEFLEWMFASGHVKILDTESAPLHISWDEVTNTPVHGLSHHEFLWYKLTQFTPQEQDVLKVASSLGFRFARDHVEHILGFSVSATLDKLACNNVLVPGNSNCELLQFCHGGLQQVAYKLVRDDERNLFHLEVGRRLWRKMDQDEVDRHLFLFLTHMHVGRELMRRENEKFAVATLCLRAGQQAARSSSFRIALAYFNFGIEMLPPRSWRDNYDLSLALFTSATEMDCCASNFENVARNMAEVVENAQSDDDKVQVYATKMMSLSAQHNFGECVELGLEVLKQLGISYPRRLRNFYLLREIMVVERLLWRKSDEQILRMPHLTDEKQLRILHILSLIFFPAMADLRSDLVAFVIVKSMAISLKSGLCPLSSFAFNNYGFLAIGMGRIKTGTRYGAMGLKLLDHFQAFELLPRVSGFYYGLIHPWLHPLHEGLDPLRYARDVAFQSGDFEFAALCGHSLGWMSIECGFPLEETVKEWTKFGEFLRKNHPTLLHVAEISLQFVHHIMGRKYDPLMLKSSLVVADKVPEPTEDDDNTKWDIYHILANRMKLGYLLGDVNMAEENCLSLKQLKKIPQGTQRASVSLFVGLVLAESARHGRNRRSNIRIVARLVRELRKWADVAPHNFSHQAFLLEAELAALRGKNRLAFRDYIYSINMAKGSRNCFLTGLANECLAKHLVKLGNLEPARAYFTNALEGYEEWQGHAKVRALKEFVREIYGT